MSYEDAVKKSFEEMGLKIDIEKVREIIDRYNWRDAEKCMSELQFAINLFTIKQILEGKLVRATRSAMTYDVAVNVFRTFRTLLEEDGLLKIEDYEKAEEELEKEGKSLDEAIEKLEE